MTVIRFCSFLSILLENATGQTTNRRYMGFGFYPHAYTNKKEYPWMHWKIAIQIFIQDDNFSEKLSPLHDETPFYTQIMSVK